MEKFELLPERVGKRGKSLKARAPLVQRSKMVSRDAPEFPLPLLVLQIMLNNMQTIVILVKLMFISA